MNKTYTTTLSGKELEIIEKLIIEHGNVVNSNNIHEKLGKNRGKQEIKNFISNLVKKGWLIRIKRGVFVISDISGRGSIELSQLTVAQIIDNNSYISFEGALQHHGLFDQYLRVITSIGNKRTYTRKFSDWVFKYIKTKKELFKDFKEYNIDGQLVKIASKEKAIMDFLTYRRTAHDIDLVIEKLKNYKNDFDIQILIEISQDCSITTKRMLGVVLDIANIDSSELYKTVKDNKNHSFMTLKSDAFNAKWRIYTDKHFAKN
jgi:predicted transcriptional regulator of viral defense system